MSSDAVRCRLRSAVCPLGEELWVVLQNSGHLLYYRTATDPSPFNVIRLQDCAAYVLAST